MKKIIGLDLDDVILDFNQGFLQFYNEKHNTSFKRSDINKYEYHQIFGLSDEETLPLFEEFTFSPYHIETAPLFGAIEALSKLNEHDLYIISARPEHKRVTITDWLKKHLPEVKFKEIHLTGPNKSETAIQKSKAELAKELNVDIFVEDALHNALPIAQAGISVLLFDTPWNQLDPLPPGITRVYSWEQIMMHMSKLNK